jgi:hypothetical protein
MKGKAFYFISIKHLPNYQSLFDQVIYYHKSKAAKPNLLTQDNTKYSTISTIDKTFKTKWFLNCYRLYIFSLNSHLLARMAPRGCHQQWLPGEAGLFLPEVYI